MHEDPLRSIREDDFRGHHIVIATTNEITVDGRPLSVHIGLSNDGSAHSHGLPAYQFASVVDMVRALIDYFPDDFSSAGDPDGGSDLHGQPREHSEHDRDGV